jgi:hypothetical protein
MGSVLKYIVLAATAGAAAVGTPAAAATDGANLNWEIDVDGRSVSVNGPPPIIAGGLGATRFGGNESGARLGRARFALEQNLGEVWSLSLDASSWGDRDKTPVGLTEAYLQWRPYPFAGYRLRVKTGAFYAPVSLENRIAGWESPYTLSDSAIDSWLAQELRTLGSEAQLDWLGRRSGHDFEFGMTAGVFGWNDNAGAAIANGGWTLTDRQSVLCGRVGKPGVQPVRSAEPFREMDGHAGFYGGLEFRYLDRLVVRYLRYDNNADPREVDFVSHTIAWNTQFDSAGFRIQADHGWTGIVQWMNGYTVIAPQGTDERWPFRARYVLLSKRFGEHTLSARFDWFKVDGYHQEGDDDGWQVGHASTLAYVFQPDTRWRFTLEWLHVVSTSYNRADMGGALLGSQTQLQLAVRYALGPAAR